MMNELMINKECFSEWFKLWLEGIPSELSFWDNYMEKRGDIYFYTFENTIDPKKKFVLENDIPKNLFGKNVNYIDVGAGPFSRCGTRTDKVKLKCTFVDPLAEASNEMKLKYNIDNGVTLKTGFVEFLDQYFSSNTFDLVHMSNSLDHTFNPILGIYQLLNICKIGGIVILRHSQNEAVNANYGGLHQWNLCIEKNHFFIWRHNDKVDVTSLFSDYADILLYPNMNEEGWIYNKIVFKKKKDVSVPKCEYYRYAFDMIYSKMLNIMLKKNDMKCIRASIFELLMDRINVLYHDSSKFEKIKRRIHNYDCIDIYGMSILGESLYRLLDKYQEKIGYIIDRKDINFNDKKTIRIDDYNPLGRRLLVTTAYGINSEGQMIEAIKNLSLKVDYISLYDLLELDR